jgi:hypothetical protein
MKMTSQTTKKNNTVRKTDNDMKTTTNKVSETSPHYQSPEDFAQSILMVYESSPERTQCCLSRWLKNIGAPTAQRKEILHLLKK